MTNLITSDTGVNITACLLTLFLMKDLTNMNQKREDSFARGSDVTPRPTSRLSPGLNMSSAHGSTQSAVNASLIRSPAPSQSYYPISGGQNRGGGDQVGGIDLEITPDDLVGREVRAITDLLSVNELQHAQVVSALLLELEKSFKEAAFFKAQSQESQTQVLVLSKERDELAVALAAEQRRAEQLVRRVEAAEGDAGSCRKQMDLKDQQIAALHGELSRLVGELDRTRLDVQRLTRSGAGVQGGWQGGGVVSFHQLPPQGTPYSPAPSSVPASSLVMQSPVPSSSLRF